MVGRRGGSGRERRRRTLTQEARRTTWRVNRRTENVGQGGELECDDARAIEHGRQRKQFLRTFYNHDTGYNADSLVNKPTKRWFRPFSVASRRIYLNHASSGSIPPPSSPCCPYMLVVHIESANRISLISSTHSTLTLTALISRSIEFCD
jgi:hypothetical protein